MKNNEECNPNKHQIILILFDDVITDMPSYRKPNPIVTELFIRSKKHNICLLFITQSFIKFLSRCTKKC